MQSHQLHRKNKNKQSRQIGRGGKRGTTAGRGTKGQKARAGHKIRPEIRDIIKKLPKKRGYRFKPVSAKFVAINLSQLEAKFQPGEVVSPESLLAKSLLRRRAGKLMPVKILATGNLSKKLSFKNCAMSAKAQKIIIERGGALA